MSNQGWRDIRPRVGALAASAFDPPEGGGGGGGGTVTPPAATTEALPDTDTPTAKTFSAFTDTEGLIDNYLSEIVDIEGTTTASGSGLGPYTYSGAGPGSAFMHLLHARDADDNILATAAHGVDIMPSAPSGGGSPVTPPASTFEAVASGGSPAAKTFGAFVDPDGLIDNYVSTVVDIVGTTSATGTDLGAYNYGPMSDGDAFVHTLTARDASNNPLATAVHGVQVAAAGGAFDWEDVLDIDLTGADFTARTLTAGAAAVQLMRADGVTPTGLSLRYTTRNGSPTATVQHVVGTGLQWSVAGATTAIALAVLFDGKTALDTDVFAVDIVASVSLTNTGDGAGFGAGPTHLATAHGWCGAYYYRSGASAYTWYPIRGIGSSITAGIPTGTLTGPTADIAWTNIVLGGRPNLVYTAQQSSVLSGVPSGAGVTKHLLGDSQTATIGTTPNRFGSAIWVTSDLFAATAGATTGTIKRIRLRRVRVT